MPSAVRRPLWLEAAGVPVAAVLTGPEHSDHGVVLLPALGYEYWTTYALLRDLAWSLAESGCASLRLDYPGTGDSGGDPWELDVLEEGRTAVRTAVAELRRRGCSRVSLVGVRVGATVALADAAALDVDAVVAISPVRSGKRYVRELAMLGQRVPEGVREGALVSGGVPFPEPVLASLRALDVASAQPPPRVLLVEEPDDPDDVVEGLRARGAAVERVLDPGLAEVLRVPTEKSLVPWAVVEAVTQWLAPGPVSAFERTAADGPPRTFTWGAGQVVEAAVSLGDTGLTAVRSDPLTGPSTRAVLLLNTGSEHHVGPGRAWVELARHLALSGTTCFRLDYRGWGESVLQPVPPGRPYAESAVVDTATAAAALKQLGFQVVAAVGLCSSAWIGLQAGRNAELDGVYALNPQLYWRRGDPDDITADEAAVWRARRAEREARGQRLGLWSLMDAVWLRPRASRWLDALARRGVSVRLAFAAGDPGERYLRDRLARRATLLGRERLSVVALPGIDHQMHREWLRPSVLADVTAWLEGLDR